MLLRSAIIAVAVLIGMVRVCNAEPEKRMRFVQRLSFDMAMLGAWEKAAGTYDFFVNDPATSRQATGLLRLRNSGFSLGTVVGSIVRIRPQMGVGIELSYRTSFAEPSNPLPRVVDAQFGHLDTVSIAALVEYSPAARHFGLRRGFYLQYSAGEHWVYDHARTGPTVAEFKGGFAGVEMALIAGYRIPVGRRLSILAAASGGLSYINNGSLVGLRLGSTFP